LDRIDEYLEFPIFDPHGSPIPTRNGQMVEVKATQLKDTRLGQLVEITQVIDKEAATLIQLENVGVKPGKRILISSQFPHNKGLKFKVNDKEFIIDCSIMEMVFVRVIENDHDKDLQ
jgi:DtxR family Mn-dependent transcriptional regulator